MDNGKYYKFMIYFALIFWKIQYSHRSNIGNNYLRNYNIILDFETTVEIGLSKFLCR